MNIAELQEFCKDTQTVAEYFLVIGVSDKQLQNHLNLGEPLRPAIMSQFPPFTRPNLTIPDQIAPVIFNQFCAPLGFQISYSKQPPSVYSLVSTSQTGARVYLTCMKIHERVSVLDSDLPDIPFNQFTDDISLYSSDPLNETGLHIPKILVIVSKKPFFQTFRKILKSFYALSLRPLDYPYQFYIAHFLFQVPSPRQGIIMVVYTLYETDFIFSLPPCNQLPLLDLNPCILFTSLSMDNVLTVFRYLSLQQSVVFLSKKESTLLKCSYVMLSLLYPLKWLMIYVPILPQLLLDMLGSPVNFVYGVHSDYKETVLRLCDKNVLIVDLDSDKLYSVSEVPYFPSHYGNKLKSKLQTLLKKQGARKPSFKLQRNAKNLRFFTSVREFFFQFFVCIFKNYKKFMIFAEEAQSFFDKQKFLLYISENSRSFYSELFKTQMFQVFCQERVRPASVEQHGQNLFFDESITAKQNRSSLRLRKRSTPFITDKSQEHQQLYIVPPIQTPNQRVYEYPRFPILDSSLKFPQFEKPPNYESLGSKPTRVTGANLSDFNCILMCWIEVWAATLWYQDKIELPGRISELLEQLLQFKNVPPRVKTAIYGLILNATSKVDPTLALPIYQLMVKSEVMIDAATIHVLQNVFSSLKHGHHELMIRETGESLEFKTELSNTMKHGGILRNRVFTKQTDQIVQNKEDACFLFDERCQICKKRLKAKDIWNGWTRRPNQLESQCVGCGNLFIPNLKIRIGADKSFVEQECWFVSPQHLKQMVSNLLDSEMCRLDIEKLRSYNSQIFWNLIWHFISFKLPIDFIMPYDNELDIRSEPAQSPEKEDFGRYMSMNGIDDIQSKDLDIFQEENEKFVVTNIGKRAPKTQMSSTRVILTLQECIMVWIGEMLESIEEQSSIVFDSISTNIEDDYVTLMIEMGKLANSLLDHIVNEKLDESICQSTAQEYVDNMFATLSNELSVYTTAEKRANSGENSELNSEKHEQSAIEFQTDENMMFDQEIQIVEDFQNPDQERLLTLQYSISSDEDSISIKRRNTDKPLRTQENQILVRSPILINGHQKESDQVAILDRYQDCWEESLQISYTTQEVQTDIESDLAERAIQAYLSAGKVVIIGDPQIQQNPWQF